MAVALMGLLGSFLALAMAAARESAPLFVAAAGLLTVSSAAFYLVKKKSGE
jgi:hypothetical protein